MNSQLVGAGFFLAGLVCLVFFRHLASGAVTWQRRALRLNLPGAFAVHCVGYALVGAVFAVVGLLAMVGVVVFK